MNPQSNYIPALSQTPSTTTSDNNSKIPFRFAATPYELFQKGLDLAASENLGNELIYRDSEPTLEIVTAGRPWSFDGDGERINT